MLIFITEAGGSTTPSMLPAQMGLRMGYLDVQGVNNTGPMLGSKFNPQTDRWRASSSLVRGSYLRKHINRELDKPRPMQVKGSTHNAWKPTLDEPIQKIEIIAAGQGQINQGTGGETVS